MENDMESNRTQNCIVCHAEIRFKSMTRQGLPEFFQIPTRAAWYAIVEKEDKGMMMVLCCSDVCMKKVVEGPAQAVAP
jgi:hypothetical protein